MSTIKEKRTESRVSCHYSARYANFARSVFYNSQIVDFSEAGMRIKTKVPVKIGAMLMVHVTGPLQDARTDVEVCCPPNRSIGIGQVRWCEKSGPYEMGGYDFGLKFQVPEN